MNQYLIQKSLIYNFHIDILKFIIKVKTCMITDLLIIRIIIYFLKIVLKFIDSVQFNNVFGEDSYFQKYFVLLLDF
jgi:hypothetical protein